MPTSDRWFFLAVVALCLYVLQPLWPALVTGLILAFLCEGPVFRLYDRWHAKSGNFRFLIAGGYVLAVSSLFIAPLVLLSWSATNELLGFWKDMNGDSSAMETGQKAIDWINQTVSPWIQATGFNVDVSELSNRIKAGVEPFLRNIALHFADILSGTPAVILFASVATMAWVYFLVHGRDQRRIILPQLIPWPRQRDIICNTMAEVLRALVLTSLVLSIVQSLLVVITLGLAGVPKYYLWGALAFFMSFVPVFGTAPVMIGAATYCYVHDQAVAGTIILLMAVFIGSIDNVVRPLLMKGSTEMNFFWLFMALVGGIAVFGLGGAVIGPWAFAMFSELERQWRSHDAPHLS